MDIYNSRFAYESLITVLDSLDALVYVSDMETYEMIYINKYGRSIWGEPKGRPCWQILQADQTGPCSFCTNHLLLDEHGEPKDVYVWEFQNTVTRQWFQCRDQAIRWPDGRMVRMEIAIDITERKSMEEALKSSKDEAERLASVDVLTGLKNRRAFMDSLKQHYHESLRFGKPLSLMLLDLDKFKNINDSYGHGVGDIVLQQFGRQLTEIVRTADIVGRIGGEEFAILLPETALEETCALAERLREGITSLDVETGENLVTITASIGVYEVASDDTIDDFVRKADIALYKAKHNGRNRVEPY